MRNRSKSADQVRSREDLQAELAASNARELALSDQMTKLRIVQEVSY